MSPINPVGSTPLVAIYSFIDSFCFILESGEIQYRRDTEVSVQTVDSLVITVHRILEIDWLTALICVQPSLMGLFDVVCPILDICLPCSYAVIRSWGLEFTDCSSTEHRLTHSNDDSNLWLRYHF